MSVLKLVSLSMMAMVSGAAMADYRGVQVTTFGAEMGVDREFNNRVLSLLTRKIVAEATVERELYKYPGKVAKYKLVGVGDEGGQTFCIELVKNATKKDVDALINDFEELKNVLPPKTLYKVSPVVACP